ncbi:ligand-dependent nuclear receptor-interacting factor 1 [Danio aesculapii]|uniref:ligand-dependent nuclear receptor-interacting factor 1 n=1 Tax=Danio aesculapii TaxID=1142201 RepID=UPI0024C0461B|nr:ligand-dependent nuclear receptor-interacting factor 1 [Danio aesculapii]
MEGGTGVYYQAMPAVGPDGKNVMKLIPVQKVNGQFYQTSLNSDRDNVDLQLKAYAKPVHSPTASSSQTQPRLPSLQATADGRYVLNTSPEVRTLSNPVRTLQGGTNNLIIHSPKQVHVPPSAHSVSQYTVQLSPQPSPKSMTAVQTLPVTVKSPVLPNGHFLEIPPNAKVRTMPATALPQSIKCRILNSVNNISNPDKTPPTVVLVSPVNSVRLNSDQQVVSLAKQSQVQKTLSQNPSANRQTPVCVPKTNEVNTPIKWVIQEGTGASARCLIPVSSQNVNSDSVKTVTHVNSNEIAASKPTLPQTILEKITPGKDNALVMCNGKVYFVARKNSEIAKDVLVSEGQKRGVLSISPALPASSAPALNSSNPDPKASVSEVIDLCDDDDAEETSTCLGDSPVNLPTPSQTEADESDEESNVIFVSYIPPKTTAKAASSDSQIACEEHVELSRKSVTPKEGENVAYAEVDSDSGIDNLSDVMDELVKENDMADGNLSFVSKSVNIEEEKDVVNESSSEARCQDDAVVIEYARVLEQPQNLCNRTTENIEKAFENPTPSHQPKSDRELRKEFGITSYIQICLQKPKPTVARDQQKEKLIINKRTLDGLRKVIQDSKLQSKIQQMIQAPHIKTEEDEVLKAKRQRKEQEWTEETPNLSTTNTIHISECSDVPMRSSCQEEVCSPLKSAANKDRIRSEMAADVSGSTCCLTPSLPQKAPQTASHLFSPFPARNVPPRVKKGKMCTACPCGTILGASESTSSHEKTNPCTDSNKGTKTICSNKPPEENCQAQKHQPKNPVKKSEKKPSSKSPVKDLAPLESCISETLLNVSSVNVTSSAASSVGTNQTAEAPSVQTEISNTWSRNANAETSQQNTGQCETNSNYTSMPLSKNYLGPKMDKFPMQELYSLETLDAEEIKRLERIKRLKDLLKEKEAALQRMQNMNI